MLNILIGKVNDVTLENAIAYFIEMLNEDGITELSEGDMVCMRCYDF